MNRHISPPMALHENSRIGFAFSEKPKPRRGITDAMVREIALTTGEVSPRDMAKHMGVCISTIQMIRARRLHRALVYSMIENGELLVTRSGRLKRVVR